MKEKLLLSVYLFLFSVSACAASFDCAKAKSFAEKTICADQELSAADDELYTIYKEVKIIIPEDQKSSFKSETKNQWLWREKNCIDKECLLTWYQKRKFDLANEKIRLSTQNDLSSAHSQDQKSEIEAPSLDKPKPILQVANLSPIESKSETRGELEEEKTPSKLETPVSEKSKKDDVSWKFKAGFALFIVFAILGWIDSTKCPNCKRKLADKEVKREYVDQRLAKSSSGIEIYNRYRVTYRCPDCKHEWSSITEKKDDGEKSFFQENLFK